MSTGQHTAWCRAQWALKLDLGSNQRNLLNVCSVPGAESAGPEIQTEKMWNPPSRSSQSSERQKPSSVAQGSTSVTGMHIRYRSQAGKARMSRRASEKRCQHSSERPSQRRRDENWHTWGKAVARDRTLSVYHWGQAISPLCVTVQQCRSPALEITTQTQVPLNDPWPAHSCCLVWPLLLS